MLLSGLTLHSGNLVAFSHIYLLYTSSYCRRTLFGPARLGEASYDDVDTSPGHLLPSVLPFRMPSSSSVTFVLPHTRGPSTPTHDLGDPGPENPPLTAHLVSVVHELNM